MENYSQGKDKRDLDHHNQNTRFDKHGLNHQISIKHDSHDLILKTMMIVFSVKHIIQAFKM